METKLTPKQYIKRTVLLLPVLPVLALSIAMCLYAGEGADPSTTFQQGLGNILGMRAGTINLIYNTTILVIFLFANRKLVGIGSIVVGFCLGPLMNVFEDLLHWMLPMELSLWIRLGIAGLGIVMCAAALAWYVPLDVGVQPMDMVIITLSNLLKKSYGTASRLYGATMLILTFVVGGDFGIVTIMNVALGGLLCDFFRKRFAPLRRRFLDEEPISD